METILNSPDEVWMSLEYLKGKKITVLNYYYLKMINKEKIKLVIRQIKGVKTIISVYPDGMIDESRMGWLLYKKESD